MLHRIDDDEPEDRREHDEDQQRADERGEPSHRPELIARHLPEAAAVAAGREQQDGHVLYAAAEDRTYQYPQRARQITELRGERRTHERTGARDRGEVMAEYDGTMCRHEIAAVVEALGWCGPRGIDHQHPCGDPGRVETIAEQVDAHRGSDDPQSIDRLVPMERDARRGDSGG